MAIQSVSPFVALTEPPVNRLSGDSHPLAPTGWGLY